jgi:hypothetical protein
MHKKWLFSGLITVFLAANLLYWLPAMANPSVCPPDYKCFFNDEGGLLLQTLTNTSTLELISGGSINLDASSSTGDIKLKTKKVTDGGHIYLNYVNSGAYGLGVSPSGQLYHDGFSLVVADKKTYGISISGGSGYLNVDYENIAPLDKEESQSFVASINQSYWESNPNLTSVIGLSSLYNTVDKSTGLPVTGQLALIKEGNSSDGFNQYLQFRFNSSTAPETWDYWHRVCDNSNNCHNFINFLDNTASSSLVMYGDPNLLVDSGLKIGSADLANCGSLNTVGGVIGCGAAGSGGGVAGSGTINYLPKWSNTSTLANSLIYDNGTNVGVGDSSPSNKLSVNGTVSATTLKSNVINCSNGLKTDPTGTITCNTNPFLTTDQYWTGTATNLVSSTARASLGLGSLATLSAVSGGVGGTITDGTITNADISGSAAIAASKIEYGAYFINSAGTSGQVWTSDGNGAGSWVALAAGSGGGVAGSGTINYLPKWSNTSTLADSLIYDNGTNVGIGTDNPGAKLEVNGNIRTTVDNVLPNIVLDSSSAGDNWTSQGAYISLGESGSLGAAALHLTYIGSGSSYIGSGAVTNGVPAQSYFRFSYSSKMIYTDSVLQVASSGPSYFSGNLGIGTTSPNYKLSVVGTGYFSNPVIVGTPTQDGHATTKAYVDDQQIAWSRISSFPTACSAGQVVTGIGNTLTCTTTAATHTPLTLANIGSTPNAQGASLSDQALTLQPASASYGGIVTTGTQTFAGTKTFSSTIQGNISGSAAQLAANGDNCSAGYYPLGVDEKGKAEDCTPITGGGTYTADGNGLELVGNSFRLELDGTTLSTSPAGLKVNAIGSTEISDGAIANADISSLAAINWSKINKVGSNLTDLATRSHASLTNLTNNDDHPQYVLSAGRATSQSIKGSTAANGRLQIQATSHGTVTPTSEAIQFFVNSWGADQAMTILHNGNIGISQTNPTYKLDVGGDINLSGTLRVNGAAFSGSNWTVSSNNLYNNNYGNVGIGTSSPGSKLTVAGTVSFDNGNITSNGSGDFFVKKIFDKDNNSYFIDPAASYGNSITVLRDIETAGNFKLSVSGKQYQGYSTDSAATPSFSWIGDTNTGLFRKAADTIALTTGGSEKFSINSTGRAVFTDGSNNLMIIDPSGTVTIGDGNAPSKLNVGTVDPIYTIDGQKYATYMAGMTGVKEETSGALVLDKQSAGLFMAKLDFQDAPLGSDIWLFGRTTNLVDNQEHFDQTSCLLTPNFAGQAWYEKDWDGRSINIFARPDNVNRASVEVSYRLTAPRFDSEKWTNYSDSQHDGFNLDELLK